MRSQSTHPSASARSHAALTDGCVSALGAPWDRPLAPPPPDALFRRHWVDVLLTRSHPFLPHVLLGPAALALAWWGWTRVGPLEALLWLGAGALAWTLLEYLMHRWFFHLDRRTEVRRVIAFLAHGHHHVHPGDRRRLAATPLQFLSTTLLFMGVWLVVAGGAWPLALAGSTLGYLVYELVHYRAHFGRPRTALGRALRRHHLAHHHRDDGRRFGISSPLWDWVFRTG